MRLSQYLTTVTVTSDFNLGMIEGRKVTNNFRDLQWALSLRDLTGSL